MVLSKKSSLKYHPDFEFNRVAESLLFQAQYAYDYYIHYMYNYLKKRKPLASEEALKKASHIHAKNCADKVLKGLVAKDIAIKRSFSKQLYWYGSIHGSSNDYQQCEAINNQQKSCYDMYFHNSYLKQNWKYLPNGKYVYENTRFTSLVPICFADSLFLFDFCLLKPEGISQRCGYLVETAADFNIEKRKLEPALKFTLHVPKNDLQEFNDLEEVVEAKETIDNNGKFSGAKVYYTPREFDNDIESIHTACCDKTIDYSFDCDFAMTKDLTIQQLDNYIKNDKTFLHDENIFYEKFTTDTIEKSPLIFKYRKAPKLGMFEEKKNVEEKADGDETLSKASLDKKISYFQSINQPKPHKDEGIKIESVFKEKLTDFEKNSKVNNNNNIINNKKTNISFSKAWFNQRDEEKKNNNKNYTNDYYFKSRNLSGPKPFKSTQHVIQEQKEPSKVQLIGGGAKKPLPNQDVDDDDDDDFEISSIPPPLTFDHLEEVKKMREEVVVEKKSAIPKVENKKLTIKDESSNSKRILLSPSPCELGVLNRDNKRCNYCKETPTPFSTPNTLNRAFKETPKRTYDTYDPQSKKTSYRMKKEKAYYSTSISPIRYKSSKKDAKKCKSFYTNYPQQCDNEFLNNDLTPPRYKRTLNKDYLMTTPKSKKKNSKKLFSNDRNIVGTIIKLLTPKSMQKNSNKMIRA
uniref:NADAR domain-containing protein n=1 Tax=Strongyloides stercoralis TaxID=6248 RepID=A0A0K0E1D5_STRER